MVKHNLCLSYLIAIQRGSGAPSTNLMNAWKTHVHICCIHRTCIRAILFTMGKRRQYSNQHPLSSKAKCMWMHGKCVTCKWWRECEDKGRHHTHEIDGDSTNHRPPRAGHPLGLRIARPVHDCVCGTQYPLNLVAFG